MNDSFIPIDGLNLDTSLFFKILFEKSAEASIIIIDKEGIILAVNDGMRNAYGYSSDDIVGKNFSELFVEEDRKRGKPEKELAQAKENGSSNDHNYILDKKRKKIWTLGETVCVHAGSNYYFIKNITNINQEKVLGSMLELSKQEHTILTEIFDSILYGVAVMDSVIDNNGEIVDFTFRILNRATESFSKKSKKDMLDKKLLDLFPDLKEMGLFGHFKEVAQTGKAKRIDFFYDRMGFNNWYKISMVKFVKGIIATFDDITKQKLISINHEQTTIMLLDSQRIAEIGSFDWDIKENKISGTPELYKIFGQEEPFTIESFYDKVHEDDMEKVKQAVGNSVENNIRFDIEYRIRVDDDIKHIWARGKVTYKDDEPVHFLGTTSDITKLKVAELKLQSAQQELVKINSELEQRIDNRTAELKEANDELNKYAYVISHDLKAPLNAIEGLVPFLKEDYQLKPLDEEGISMLEMMNTKVLEMKDLIDEVLKSAKKESITTEKIPLYPLVEKVIAMLDPPKHFHFIIQKDLPEVKFNKVSMIQLIQNLISNSIKYMDKQKPQIKISFKDQESHFQICVSDNGQGIPKDKLKKVFELFETAHDHRQTDSHGLGLAIVKKIVISAGGQIWIESEVGQGTEVNFTIPK